MQVQRSNEQRTSHGSARVNRGRRCVHGNAMRSQEASANTPPSPVRHSFASTLLFVNLVGGILLLVADKDQ